MPSRGSRRWLWRGLAALGTLLLCAGGAAAFLILHTPGNVSNPNVPFTVSPTTTTVPAPPKPKHRARPVDTFLWGDYGYDAARTRFLPGAAAPRPPLHVGWTFQDYALLEFPPVIYGPDLYLIDDDGSIKALDKATGRKLWETKVGTLAAASPALDVRHGLIFAAVLSVRGQSPGSGALIALSMKNGHRVWSRPIPAGTESSPLALGGSVYFGDQSGTVYSLGAVTGHLNWVYHASGSVKGGIALANGTLFFGDYAGRAYAVRAADGHQVWALTTNGAQFGFGSGNFYSTPAVAFGRVYMGNTDGRVYSFAQSNGQLAWVTGTGAYVYASAAVADLPGIGPTIFLGSYDGNFYAFDARSGAIRWRHAAGGRISGSATLVGGVVYFSTLGSRTTTGLDARTGRVVFTFPDGAFNPVVADPHTIYLVGYTHLYQMLPRRG